MNALWGRETFMLTFAPAVPNRTLVAAVDGEFAAHALRPSMVVTTRLRHDARLLDRQGCRVPGQAAADQRARIA